MIKYDPAWLDNLSLTGALGWGRLSPHPATLDDTAQGTRRIVPTSVAPITFFVRDDADWMLPRSGGDRLERVLSPVGRTVLDFLTRRGASFFADIVRATELPKAEIETGLWELVAAGLVTADGFDNLRALIDPHRRSGPQRSTRPRHSAGRWCLLYSAEGAAPDKAAEAVCRMLLRRYGVVFRDILARESNLPRWRDLQIAFRRLEDRGEIRGGRFVAGFIGEQFALPHAVESLRAMRQLPAHGETVTICAADPLNLVGILVPGERVPAIGGRTVTYRDGVPEGERSAGAAAAV
jgi:ATP-dependent Lhr-like helicase